VFDLPDELFVSQAYWRVLGRAADPAGYRGYLAQLRRGASRIRMLRELQGSQEALNPSRDAQGVPSVDSCLIMWPNQKSSSGFGWRWFRAVKRLERVTDADLLGLSGPLFLEAATTVLLGRTPSEAELQRAMAVCSTRKGREDVLRALRAQSPLHRRLWPTPPSISRRRAPEPCTTTLLECRQKLLLSAATTDTEKLEQLEGPATSATTAAFTIATRSYLPFVRVLMSSLHAAHGDFQLYVLLVEEVADDEDHGPWQTVLARDLALAEFDDMSVRYDVVEICTALKPMFIRWLFQTTGLQRVIYLDPDIRLYGPMTVVEHALDRGAAMVLTPHIDAPLPDDGLPDDLTVLKTGVFNLGFAAFQRCEEAGRFLDWWAHRLKTLALVNFEQNLFTDQRWCDLATAFVPSLAIVRDRGCNVAYWNLPQRSVRRTADGRWEVDDQPLVFFHFSGFSPERPQQVSKYQTRQLRQQTSALQALLSGYGTELEANGWDRLRGLPYAYAKLEGIELSPTLRALFRALHPASSGFTRAEILDMLLEQCRPEQPGLLRSGDTLSALMRHVHTASQDLRSTFDLGTPAGRSDYAGWFWSTGVFQHGLTSLICLARLAAPAPVPLLSTSA
jgi:hypothetical protein